MSSTLNSNAAAKLVRRLAPEDINAGAYVAVLYIQREHYRLWDTDCFSREVQKLTVQWLPDTEDGECDPLQVLSVCIPFVLAKNPEGKTTMLDVRQHTLGLLDPSFGRKAFRAHDKKASKTAAASKGKKKSKR
jgi:hypothetical protein